MGLVGPKARPKGVADGEQVNIPAPPEDRSRAAVERLSDLCSPPFWTPICESEMVENTPDEKDTVVLGAV